MAQLPEVLAITITRGDAVGLLKDVEKTDDPRDVESLHIEFCANLKMPTRYRQLNQRMFSDSRPLVETSVQIVLREMLEDARRRDHVEARVRKHGKIMDAPRHIRLKRFIDIEGRHLIPAPLQHLRIQPLAWSDHQYLLHRLARLNVAVFIVCVDEVSEVQGLPPPLEVDRHNRGTGTVSFFFLFIADSSVNY